MSVATLGAVRALPSPTWRTARWLLGNMLRILAVFAPLMLLLGVGVAPAAMAYFGVSAPTSVWAFAVEQAPGVFALVIGAITMAHLATHVAFGMTRRSFAGAVVISVMALALVLALVVPLGYVLEAALYRAYGWAHQAPDGLALALATSALRTAVWGLVGALNAAIWYRFGAFVGVVASPLTAVYPIVSTSMRIERAVPFGFGDVAVLIGVVALLAAAYAAAVLGVAVKGRAV